MLVRVCRQGKAVARPASAPRNATARLDLHGSAPKHRLRTGTTPAADAGATSDEVARRARELLGKWQSEQQQRWSSSSVVQFLGIGGLAGIGVGGLAVAGSMAWYLKAYPNSIEALVASKVSSVFSAALDFESRKSAFFTLPEFQYQIPDPAQLARAFADGGDGADHTAPVAVWADKMVGGLTEMNGSMLLQTKRAMRQELINEALSSPDLETRLRELREILPASIEREVLVDAELAREVWVDASILEANIPAAEPEFTALHNRVMEAAISLFPGPINQLILYLSDQPDDSARSDDSARIDLSSLVALALPADGPGSEQDREKFAGAAELLKAEFATLAPVARQILLHNALAKAIKHLPSLPTVCGELPYDMYVKTVETDLLGPLRRDARITPAIIDEVKVIFLGLPADIQAKILLTAILHPSASLVQLAATGSAEARRAQATVVRDLLSSGGVVAVKLAQMLAEDPKVPEDYRSLLGSLRDSNAAMPMATFWAQLPATLRGQVDQLGPRLGTGSVKQVHKVRLRKAAKLADGKEDDEVAEYAIATLRQGVEHECMSAVHALELSPALGLVTRRLARLMFGEFNLYAEGEALFEFAETSIGRHPNFSVVKVKHHSPKCVIEQIAQGVPVAAAISSADPRKVAEAKAILTEYHRAVFRAFTHDNLIHSDIHLGNAVMGPQPDGTEGFTIFDVAQFERSSPPETVALLWLLSAISNAERRVMLKRIAVRHLLEVSTVAGDRGMTHPRTTHPAAAMAAAFEEAIEPLENGAPPDQKTAYMLFLRAAERRGISLPKAAFPVAKMIDAMLVQQNDFDLPAVVDLSIESHLWSQLTWRDGAELLAMKVAGVVGSLWGPWHTAVARPPR